MATVGNFAVISAKLLCKLKLRMKIGYKIV